MKINRPFPGMVAALVLFCIGRGDARQGVSLGASQVAKVQKGSECVKLFVVLTGGEQLTNLKKRKTPQGDQYFKGPVLVSEFGDTVVIGGTATAGCVSKGTDQPFPVMSDLPKQLKFKLRWQTQASKKDSTEVVADKEPSDIETWDILWSESSSSVSFRFSFPSRGIPLNTPLIMTIMDEDRVELGKLSLQLGTFVSQREFYF